MEHIHIKGVFWTLWFWRFENFANSQTFCQKQSNGNVPWSCEYLCSPSYDGIKCLYWLQRGAFSVARFDRQGNAKTFKAWTGHRTGSTFFMFIV